jgi:hypothetical protein
MAKRKVGYYVLSLKEGDFSFDTKTSLLNLLDYIRPLAKIQRKCDLSGDKFAYFDSIGLYADETISILVKSAKHGYRAPLIDRNTVVVRDNPKTINEGEQMKTHMVLKFTDTDIVCIMEIGLNMFTCNDLITYLNKMVARYNEEKEETRQIHGLFGIQMIMRNDFSNALESMNRVTCANVYVDKRVLGGDLLNFSNRTETIKESVVMSIGVTKGNSAKEFAKDVFRRIAGANTVVKRIRVKGISNMGAESIIDTEFFGKKDIVDVNRNSDTGEYDSSEMFKVLKGLADDI